MTEEIFALAQKNPWWEEATLINTDDKLRELSFQPFPYRHPLLETFPLRKKGVMTLRGPRQIGKTTLTKQIIKKLLLADKIKPENIFYYSCNLISDFKQLFQLLNLYFEEYGYQNNDFLYIFLDEISFVADWPRTIKEFVEGSFGKRTLFFLTGSSTIDLEFSSERLPGRRGQLTQHDILYLPLMFADFVHLVKPDSLNWRGKESFHLGKLRRYFKEYLLTGGFPAVINQYYKNSFISSDTYKIYLSWIDGDMHKLGKSEIITEKILSRIITSLTTPLSYYEIAKETTLASHVTAFEYLDYLERLFAIFRADCFQIAEKRISFKKNRKFYFYDPFVYFAFRAKISNMLDESFSFTRQKTKDIILLPKIVEMTVASHLKKNYDNLYYGKIADREIDFVSFDKEKYHFFEVRYQETIKASEFAYFCREFPRDHLTVVSKKTIFENKNLSVIPLELFLMGLG